MVPLDTLINGITYNVAGVSIDSISGLPPGFTYNCTPSFCQTTGGGSICIDIYSINSPTYNDIGIYQLDIHTTWNIIVPILGNYPFSVVNSDYYIEIINNSIYGCTDTTAVNYNPNNVDDEALVCIVIFLIVFYILHQLVLIVMVLFYLQ